MKINSYTSLQGAVLKVLIDAKEPTTLKDIQKKAYKLSGKRKPPTASQAIAACIRNMRKKLNLIGVKIERVSDIGRGHEGSYLLSGNLDVVRKTLKEAA